METKESNSETQLSLLYDQIDHKDIEDNCEMNEDRQVVKDEIVSVNGEEDAIKYLTIKKNESVVEGNWADLPIFSFNRAKYYLTGDVKKDNEIRKFGAIVVNQKAENIVDRFIKRYKWQKKGEKEGQIISRGLEIVGSLKYGLLQFSDFEILMATSKAHYNLKGRNKIEIQDKRYLFPRELEFTYSEVAKTMGYKNAGGSELRKIDIALKRMTEVTVWNTIDGGLYDVTNKKNITNVTNGYHIIDEYIAYRYSDLKETGEKRKNYRDIKCKIKLNNFFYESMCKSYFKLFDYDMFKQIKKSIAKKIYLITHKWRGSNKKKRWFITYDVLFERIPIDENLPRFKKKEVVVNSCKELIELGYFENVIYNKTYIEFIFPHGVESSTYLLDKYHVVSEIKISLKDNYGLSEDEISDYINIDKFSLEFINYISALMRYCDYKVVKTKIKDKKKYIIGGLVGKYDIPVQFYN